MEDESRLSRRLGDSVTIELPGMVILIAILVFFLVVVFVLLLQLYARWLWSRIEEATPPPEETRSRRRRFDFSSIQDPAVPTLGGGLDPAVLRSLPVLIFHPENFKDGLECAVCLSELVQGEKARLLPDCFHGFHIECIDMWFQSHSTCPLCRNPVTPEPSNSAVCQLVESDELQEENAASGLSSESPNFPTNVLFWGNQAQVTSAGACLEEGPSQVPCPASSSASAASHLDAELVIDVQSEIHFSPLAPSASRSGNEERKLPVTTRLRSLKRLLSRERRTSPCNPSSTDVEMEQVVRAQS